MSDIETIYAALVPAQTAYDAAVVTLAAAQAAHATALAATVPPYTAQQKMSMVYNAMYNLIKADADFQLAKSNLMQIQYNANCWCTEQTPPVGLFFPLPLPSSLRY